jgi:hypothetical protein
MIAKLLFLVCLMAGVIAAQSLAPRKDIGPTAARAYYTQLYEAGGFAEVVAEDGENPLSKHFVCYNDDDSSGEFFVFTATRFDQEYSDAAVTLDKLAKQYVGTGLTHGEAMQDPKVIQALETMKKIQQATPYVHFWVGDRAKWNSLPRLQSPRFQFGTLSADVYKKGVKEGVGAWGCDENSNSWLNYSSRTTDGTITEDRTYRLFIEPKTLRYREIVTVIFTEGEGDTKVSDSKSSEESGSCEIVSGKRRN